MVTLLLLAPLCPSGKGADAEGTVAVGKVISQSRYLARGLHTKDKREIYALCQELEDLIDEYNTVWYILETVMCKTRVIILFTQKSVFCPSYESFKLLYCCCEVIVRSRPSIS